MHVRITLLLVIFSGLTLPAMSGYPVGTVLSDAIFVPDEIPPPEFPSVIGSTEDAGSKLVLAADGVKSEAVQQELDVSESHVPEPSAWVFVVSAAVMWGAGRLLAGRRWTAPILSEQVLSEQEIAAITSQSAIWGGSKARATSLSDTER